MCLYVHMYACDSYKMLFSVAVRLQFLRSSRHINFQIKYNFILFQSGFTSTCKPARSNYVRTCKGKRYVFKMHTCTRITNTNLLMYSYVNCQQQQQQFIQIISTKLNCVHIKCSLMYTYVHTYICTRMF